MEINELLEGEIRRLLNHIRAVNLLLDSEDAAMRARNVLLVKKIEDGDHLTQNDVYEKAYNGLKTRFYYSDINTAGIQAFTLYTLAGRMNIVLRLKEDELDFFNKEEYALAFRKGKGGMIEPEIPGLWEMLSNRAKYISGRADIGLEETLLMRQYKEEQEMQKQAYIAAQQQAARDKGVSSESKDTNKVEIQRNEEYQDLNATGDGQKERTGTAESEGQ